MRAMGNANEFEGVWKRFRRGELHDSLGDLISALLRRGFRGGGGRAGERFWALREVGFAVGGIIARR